MWGKPRKVTDAELEAVKLGEPPIPLKEMTPEQRKRRKVVLQMKRRRLQHGV